MKLKSLLLGSAAALALSTGAQAADPISSFVSLDVCDAYGISGLTIASDDTCLKISGYVKYEWRYGNFVPAPRAHNFRHTAINFDNDNGGVMNSSSAIDWRLLFEATTQTDAGAAKAVIRFDDKNLGGFGDAVEVTQAYVSFGDTTVLMAGKKGSVYNDGDDTEFNSWLGLFNSKAVDTGVTAGGPRTGGHVIQVVSEVADGITVKAGLENLDTTPGGLTFVGVVEAKGGWGSAHFSGAFDARAGLPVGSIWKIHTGANLKFDQFGVVGAIAADDSGYWNGLISGQAEFDMFTLSAGFEAAGGGAFNDQWGAGVEAKAAVTDTVTINGGFRYLTDTTDGEEIWEFAIGATVAVTDTLSVSGKVGHVSTSYINAPLPVVTPVPVTDYTYVDLGVTYNPGGGFKTTAGFEANTTGAYKVKFNAEKSF